MEKQILMEYIDACELIRETEQDIQRLKRKKTRYLKRQQIKIIPYGKQS